MTFNPYVYSTNNSSKRYYLGNCNNKTNVNCAYATLNQTYNSSTTASQIIQSVNLIQTPTTSGLDAPYCYQFVITNTTYSDEYWNTPIYFNENNESYQFDLLQYKTGIHHYSILTPTSCDITSAYEYNGVQYYLINPGTYSVTSPCISGIQCLKFVDNNNDEPPQTITVVSCSS